jgi:NADH:ubiquinone reductase (H+-translocating)
VLAIGCGFGGLEAVRALGTSDVDITLVDRTLKKLLPSD